MSTNPSDAWNPEDGPPPTDEERAHADRLASALEHPARHREDDEAAGVTALVDAALRVRATVHPQHDAARAVTSRVVTEVLARSRRGVVARLSPRARWGWAAAAAAFVATVTVGGRELARTRTRPTETISRPADDVFRAPIESGAGSMPSSQIFDSRLRSYRDLYFRGRRP